MTAYYALWRIIEKGIMYIPILVTSAPNNNGYVNVHIDPRILYPQFQLHNPVHIDELVGID